MRSIALLVLTLAPLALAQDGDGVALVDAAARPPVPSGQLLPAAPGLYQRWDVGRSFGTPRLIEAVERAAEHVAWKLPHADPLFIGDLSRRGGGPLEGHSTHQTGLDADLGLYRKGARQPWRGFEELRPGDLDCAATWTLIEGLLDTGDVQFILLDEGHIRVLRAWLARERGWSDEALDTVFPRGLGDRSGWRLEGIVRHAEGHKDHLHVQVRTR
jgi:hypothetical protein